MQVFALVLLLLKSVGISIDSISPMNNLQVLCIKNYLGLLGWRIVLLDLITLQLVVWYTLPRMIIE